MSRLNSVDEDLVLAAAFASGPLAPLPSPSFASPESAVDAPYLVSDVSEIDSPVAVSPLAPSAASAASCGFGVPARLGSSLSSMTKAASKTAGSGFTGASAVSAVVLPGGRFPVAVPFLREVEAVVPGALEPMPDLACSSAMPRSMAPRSLCYDCERLMAEVTAASANWGDQLLRTWNMMVPRLGLVSTRT